jgi:ribosomal protein S12 methylthiotransferase
MIDGLRWIRILYAYPHRIDERFLSVMAKHPKICRYLDIPIQHIDDGILCAMLRKGGSRALRRAIRTAREAMPDIALRRSGPADPGPPQRFLASFHTEKREKNHPPDK